MTEPLEDIIDRVHHLIPMDRQGPCNFLTLVCTGHTTGWAASFDFNLGPEWYEESEIGRYPFAARGPTMRDAVEAAALRVWRSLPSS
jgi:hypothetical protein